MSNKYNQRLPYQKPLGIQNRLRKSILHEGDTRRGVSSEKEAVFVRSKEAFWVLSGRRKARSQRMASNLNLLKNCFSLGPLPQSRRNPGMRWWVVTGSRFGVSLFKAVSRHYREFKNIHYTMYSRSIEPKSKSPRRKAGALLHLF